MNRKKNSQIKKDRRLILISGVNLTEGGPLSIFRDAVAEFTNTYLQTHHLVLLVNKKSLFENLLNNPDVTIYEFAYAKKSWILKLWFEYVHSWFLSKKIQPDLWFSIHDVTPNIITKNSVVYCHNPAPFYKLSLKEMYNEKTLAFFHFFYGIIYGINIQKNKTIIVQQDWLRKEFRRRYKVHQVVVAYPDISLPAQYTNAVISDNGIFRFCYPALPRSFKNFEVIAEAVSLMKTPHKDFEIIFTVDGTENSYAEQLVKEYGHIACIKFIGRQTRDQMWNLYAHTNCLIFPSKMETWGLPITEAKFYQKPMLVGDFTYARETVGNYKKACFFNASDRAALAKLMDNAISGTLQFDTTQYTLPEQPFVQSWKELFAFILKDQH